MANVKELNRKITALKNMQKLMRAMNMIASIKLRKLLYLQSPLQQFASALTALTRNIVTTQRQSEHPLISGYEIVKKEQIIIFTADKGLCGKHNNIIQKTLSAFIQNKEEAGVSVEVTCIGTKGASFCSRQGYTIYRQLEINERTFSVDTLRELSTVLTRRFLSREIQQVTVLYNNFLSTLQQETAIIRLLPLTFDTTSGEQKKCQPVMTEPNEKEFIDNAAELLMFYQLRTALANSYLSEHAARMTAMESATNNSEDLIYKYSRLKNRARQATITNEIIEIVSGKEAMKR